MLVILYHLKSYCNMFLPYLTTSTAPFSIKMPITTFPVLRKPNFCAVFEGETPCFIYLEFNIIFANMTISYFCWRFITLMLYAKYQHCKSQFNAQSMALFHGLVTINEKCYCSHTLWSEWAKSAVQLNKAGLRSSEIRKVKKKPYFTLYRKTRTIFKVPIPSFWALK